MAKTAQERLARRAKIRRWWHKWRRRLVIFFLLCVMAFGAGVTQLHRLRPIMIQQAEAYFEKNQEPMPGILRKMYWLGRVQEILLRDDEGLKCYMTVLDWVYDGPMVFNGIDLGVPDDLAAFTGPDEDPVVGYCMFRYIDMLGLKYKQKAQGVRELYLRDIEQLESSDPSINSNVKDSSILYRAGS